MPPAPANSTLLRAFLILALTVVVFYVLHIGQKLLIPFVLAIFIWYLINVLSFAFMKIEIRGKGLPAGLRYLASILTIAVALSLFFDFITQNINEVIRVAPSYQARVGPLVERIYDFLPFEQPPSLREFVGQLQLGGIIRNFASALGGLAGNAGIICIYVIFLFLEQRSFGPKIHGMAQGSHKDGEIFQIIGQIDRDIRKYVGIKTFTSALTGLLSYAIMFSVDLDFAAFWAMLIFFFNFVPTIGSIAATAFPSLLSLIAFEHALPIAVVIGGVSGTQVLVGNFIEPRLMGNTLNLSPLVILLSLGLWGSLWGVPGMFLCVPITVIAMIICTNFPQTRPVAVLLSGDGIIKGRRTALPPSASAGSSLQ